MGPERGPGRLGAGSSANRQLVNSAHAPSHFPGSGRAMAKVKRGLLLSICACMQPRSHNTSESQHRRKNDEMEEEKGVGYAEYLHGGTSSVPHWALRATVCHPHDEPQRYNRARGSLLAVHQWYFDALC